MSGCLIRRNLACLDQLLPAGRFAGLVRGELLGCVGHQLKTHLGKLLFHHRVGQGFYQRGVDLGLDFGRQPLGDDRRVNSNLSGIK